MKVDKQLATDVALSFAPVTLVTLSYGIQAYWFLSFLFFWLGISAAGAGLYLQRKKLVHRKKDDGDNSDESTIVRSSSARLHHMTGKARSGKLAPSEKQLELESKLETANGGAAHSRLNVPSISRSFHHENENVHDAEPSPIPPPPRTPLVIKDICTAGFNFAAAPMVQVNSRKPVPFENEIFKGELLVKLKTDPPDFYYAPYFEGRQRFFEFQIQGRFKHSMNPDEKLYFGMELSSEQMSLGLVGRSMVRIMLAVCNRIVAGVHSSYGGDKKIREYPHVVFPIESTVDRLIITPDGETPPPLGIDMLPEPIDKKARQSLTVIADTKHTYTISMHGMYMDFAKWQMVNFPGLRAVDIRTLIGDNGIRLVGYIVPRDHKGAHTPDIKKYFFGVQLNHHGNDIVPQDDVVSIASGLSASALSTNFDWSAPSPITESDENRIAQMYKRTIALSENECRMKDISCPCYIMGATANRGWLFAVRVTEETGDSFAVLRPFKSLQELEILHEKLHGRPLEIPKLPPAPKPTLLSGALPNMALGTDACTQTSTLEAMRVSIDEYLKRMLATPDGPQTLRAFVEQKVDFPVALLTGDRRQDFGIIYYAHSNSSVSLEGPVAVAAWETRWIESWLVLTSTQLCIYVGGQSRKPDRTIQLAEVTYVSKMKDEPFPGAFMEIHTVGRVFYLGMGSVADRDTWETKVSAQVMVVQASTELSLALPPDPDTAYMVKSKRRWGSERHVLNERRMYFGPVVSDADDPCRLMADLLTHILTLPVNFTTEQVVTYLDMCSQLKLIKMDRLRQLTDGERKSFFLNMYHCLAAHGLLVSGPPHSSRKLDAFYRVNSFECAGTVFSMAEIEHCILRGAMVQPKKTSRFEIPTKFLSDDPRSQLVLRSSDPRTSLVLDWGGAVCGDQVPVFSADTVVLNMQMDAVCRQFLYNNLKIDQSKKRIRLPKVCERFALDFGNTPREVCDRLLRMASPEQQTAAAKLLSGGVKDKDIKFPKKGDWKFVSRLTMLPPTGSPFTTPMSLTTPAATI